MRTSEEKTVKIFTSSEELRRIADELEEIKKEIELNGLSEVDVLGVEYELNPFNINFSLDLSLVKLKDGSTAYNE